MTPAEHPTFRLALHLTERLAGPDRAIHFDAERAARRAARWREQTPFALDGFFDRRLACDGLTAGELESLLGESADSLARRTARPAWLDEIEAAFAATGSDRVPAPPGLAGIVEPLLARSRGRLARGLEEIAARHPNAPIVPELALCALAPQIEIRAARLLQRPFAVELQAAQLEGRLAGATPEERFARFLEELHDPRRALALLEEYPVLARMIVEAARRTVESSLEMIARLAADWPEIHHRLGLPADPGALESIAGDLSDLHRGGRSVSILRFDSDLRLVYKPKSLAADARFQELLSWLDDRGFEPGFRPLAIVDRGTYGWVEHVATAPCTDQAAVERFYRRMGGYLALFYLLDATDFHHENLIAAGEHPVPVDLEALFHPRVLDGDRGLDAEHADEAAVDTVLRIGLLPQRLFFAPDSDGVDFSGLGATAGQQTPVPVLRVEDPGTDRMRYTRRYEPMPEPESRPTLDGLEIALADHASDLARGFADVYRRIVAGRDELLAPGGAIAVFADVEVRVIARPTRVYSMLLAEALHPFLLRDALDRDRFFDRLWVDVAERPMLERLVAAEARDLKNGDVPLFVTRPGSRDVFAADGERFPEVLESPPLDHVERRLAAAGEDDLDRQLGVIRGTLAVLDLRGKSWPTYRPASAPPAAPHALRAAARAIGEHLLAYAIRVRGTATWLGVTPAGASGHWSYDAIGSDLYGGLAGVAVFLGLLGQVEDDERFTLLAREALAMVDRRARRGSPVSGIGGYAGEGGLLYARAYLGTLWREQALLDAARGGAAAIARGLPDDDSYDVIAGAAGALAALLRLDRLGPTPEVAAVAIACGEHLLAHAESMPTGLAWRVERHAPQPLTGFSHGAAGIGWALLELGRTTGDARFAAAGRAAFEYERSLFDPSSCTWPDLRAEASGGEREAMCAWCHGAPGIGLARAAALPILGAGDVEWEIRAALTALRREGLGHNHSLCHGDVGNLDLLLVAGRALGDERLIDEARASAGVILASVDGDDRRGWLCGTPLGVETPALLTGLAGIGYQLLRLAEPEGVPSVLLLELPNAEI